MKDKTLENLKLLKDEPVDESSHFQLELGARQIEGIVMEHDLPTPFAIVLHGEWGGGKTSVLKWAYSAASNSVKNNDEKYDDWKVLWFDAWEYERLDPVPALMQKISLEYKDQDRSGKLKEAIKKFTFFSLDVAFRKTTNMKLDDVLEYFESAVEEIPTIRQELSK